MKTVRTNGPTEIALNPACFVCGQVIRSKVSHQIGGGLQCHKRCRVGTKRWYASLGRPVEGHEGLFNPESDALMLRLYAGVALADEKEQDDVRSLHPEQQQQPQQQQDQ